VKVGEFTVVPVVDGCFPMKPTELFLDTNDDQWVPHRDLLDDDGKLRFTTGGFLIRRRDRVALVDLGVGPAPADVAGYDGGRFMRSLAAMGVDVAEVTDVILTHLHYDHVGWATSEGAPTFPQATYRCHQADWDHFVIQNPGLEKDLIYGAADRFEMWTGDESILPGVDGRWAPGHTPGSTVVVLSSGSDRAILLGDVVHCAVELVDDEWDGIYDVDPELAKRTRLALVQEIEGDRIPVAAAHFPDLQFGRLLPAQGRRLWSI
jgi:glyoxylase-like metal-dependent hydrolase (beta-lactamase superfamily II)